MATTQQVAAPAQKKGCSGIIVFMIASLALVAGIVAGAGIIIVYLQQDPGVAANMGIELPQAEAMAVAPADGETDTADGAAEEENSVKADYALLYPIEESLRIEGELDDGAVKKQIKEQRYQLRECYQKGMSKDPDLKGEMGLQFTASKSGKVLVAVERHTKFPSAQVNCILDEIKGWSFNEKNDGMSVVKFDVLMIPISSAAAGAPE